MYTLVGLELFSNSVKFNFDESQVLSASDPSGISPRNNFDDFYHSFLVVIQIMVSDNWDAIMITIARAKGNLAIVYFVSTIIIGVMFFLNIFLAILLENFGVDSEIMGGGIANTNALS
jgi:hypothetical protein